MGLMLNFFRAYPWQTVIMLAALLVSGIAEGVGLSALLPLLNIALGGKNAGELSRNLAGHTTVFGQKSRLYHFVDVGT